MRVESDLDRVLGSVHSGVHDILAKTAKVVVAIMPYDRLVREDLSSSASGSGFDERSCTIERIRCATTPIVPSLRQDEFLVAGDACIKTRS